MSFYDTFRLPIVHTKQVIYISALEPDPYNPSQAKSRPRPRSRRWRRPKLWRARDILERRQVQGEGFRGEVRSATVARREFAIRVRREEAQRRAANAKSLDTWRTAWQIWQRMLDRQERERLLVVGRPEAFETFCVYAQSRRNQTQFSA